MVIYEYFLFTKISGSKLHGQRRQWHATPVLLPGNSRGRRSLIGCSPWGCEESDTTELSLSLSCIGEGNGNPLQCSCLENPRDGRAWWAAVSGVAESRTRLKRLSSSSSSIRGQALSYTCLYVPHNKLQHQHFSVIMLFTGPSCS